VDGKLVDKPIVDRARRISEFEVSQSIGFTA
jgi:citrate lyase beta subunit